jgi:hypothetical protein
MNLKITYDDLILYYYGETNAQRTVDILQELEFNQSLRNDFEELCKISAELDKGFAEPNETSVHIVMEESLSSNLEQTI